MEASTEVEPVEVEMTGRHSSEATAFYVRTEGGQVIVTWPCGEEFEFDRDKMDEIVAGLQALRSAKASQLVFPLENYIGQSQYARLVDENRINVNEDPDDSFGLSFDLTEFMRALVTARKREEKASK